MDNSFNDRTLEQVRTPSEHICGFLKKPVVLFVGVLSAAAAILLLFSVSTYIAAPGADGNASLAAAALALVFPFAAVSAALGALIAVIFSLAAAGRLHAAFLNVATVAASLRLALAIAAAVLFIYASARSVFIDRDADTLFSSVFNLRLGEEPWADVAYNALGYSLLIALCIALALNAVYHITAVRLAAGIGRVFGNRSAEIPCIGAVYSFNIAAVCCFLLLAAAESVSCIVRAANGEELSLVPLIFLFTAAILYAVKSRVAGSLSSHMKFPALTVDGGPTTSQYYGDGFSDDGS